MQKLVYCLGVSTGLLLDLAKRQDSHNAIRLCYYVVFVFILGCELTQIHEPYHVPNVEGRQLGVVE